MNIFWAHEHMANSFRYKVKISERQYHGDTVSEVVARYYDNSYLSLFYAFYLLVMRRCTFLRLNRPQSLTRRLKSNPPSTEETSIVSPHGQTASMTIRNRQSRQRTRPCGGSVYRRN